MAKKRSKSLSDAKAAADSLEESHAGNATAGKSKRKNGKRATAKKPRAAGERPVRKQRATTDGGATHVDRPASFVPSPQKPPSRIAVQLNARKHKQPHSKPKQTESLVNDEVIRGIARMKSEGAATYDIAKRFLISEQTVTYYYRKYIWPSVMEDCVVEYEVSLDRIRHYMQRCWEAFSSDVEDTSVRAGALIGVRWAIEHSAKIQGHYAPETLKIEQAETFRVAGLTAEQVQEKLGEQLAEHIARRKRIEDKKNVLAAVRYTEPMDVSKLNLDEL